MTNQIRVELRHLNKSYVDVRSSVCLGVLDDLSLSLHGDEILSILGPSGCGKSTLLNIVAGLVEPTSGVALVLDSRPSEVQSEISYIQQSPYLLSYRTVLSNAALGLELIGEVSDDSLDRLRTSLHFLGFEGFLSKYPSELSGGMRQRLAYVRAMAVKAPLVLGDEPFSSLDFDSRLEIEDHFWKTIRSRGNSSMLVTHHIDSAIAMSDRVLILSHRPARIIETISIEPSFASLPPNERRGSSEFARYYSKIWDAFPKQTDR